MRKTNLLILIFLCPLILTACNVKNTDNVVKEIEYHKEGDVIKFAQRETINQILGVIQSAKKNKKVIDIGKTDEKLVILYNNNDIKTFDLYIDFDKSAGIVVDEADSNYAYELSSKSIKALKKILEEA